MTMNGNGNDNHNGETIDSLSEDEKNMRRKEQDWRAKFGGVDENFWLSVDAVVRVVSH